MLSCRNHLVCTPLPLDLKVVGKLGFFKGFFANACFVFLLRLSLSLQILLSKFLQSGTFNKINVGMPNILIGIIKSVMFAFWHCLYYHDSQRLDVYTFFKLCSTVLYCESSFKQIKHCLCRHKEGCEEVLWICSSMRTSLFKVCSESVIINKDQPDRGNYKMVGYNSGIFLADLLF